MFGFGKKNAKKNGKAGSVATRPVDPNLAQKWQTINTKNIPYTTLQPDFNQGLNNFNPEQFKNSFQNETPVFSTNIVNEDVPNNGFNNQNFTLTNAPANPFQPQNFNPVNNYNNTAPITNATAPEINNIQNTLENNSSPAFIANSAQENTQKLGFNGLLERSKRNFEEQLQNQNRLLQTNNTSSLVNGFQDINTPAAQSFQSQPILNHQTETVANQQSNTAQINLAANSQPQLTPEQQAQLQQAQIQAQQIVASLSDEDKEYLVFINNLVAAMTGLSLLDIAEEQRDATIDKCTQIFSDFIVDYIKTKYGDKEAMRIKSAQIFDNQDIFNKFKELGDMFDEAYNVFLQTLKDSWNQSTIDN